VRHKVDVELRSIEERTEQTIAKYIARLQNGGERLIGGIGGMNNVELDIMLNSLKDEIKSYSERIVS